MASDKNELKISGTLTKDAETKFTKIGDQVCSFSIAVNRYVKDDNAEHKWKSQLVGYFDCVAWNDEAGKCATYKKGGHVDLTGRLSYRSWEAKDGSKRSKVEIVVASSVIIPKPVQQSDVAASVQQSFSGENVTDDDIPF